MPSNSYGGAKHGNWKKNSGGTSQSTATTLVCSKCGIPHSGKCLLGSGACFRCGRMGHQKKDCRMPMNSGAPQQPYGGGAQVRRLLLEGCEGYMAFVIDTPAGEHELDKIPVVCEFPDVFPEDLLGLPPDLEVESGIELAPSTVPISKASYRMVKTKV
ncbi:uncharacterized protein LOC131149195 [Malania oleifera]|uniref:uncharacterized protein LOC131149195 n=1 Tax=Malania oleifera TaxID=397392 RepID=UPI0025ADDDC3|nr:uncharacterized protein LOC131149195 [Malania oleifera]